MNNEKNKEKWLKKVEETMKIGGKSKITFINYRSHLTRFLNNYSENTIISKMKEEEITKYILDNYIKLNKCAASINVGFNPLTNKLSNFWGSVQIFSF